MAKQSDYVNRLVDMLQPLGPVRSKAMFGGWGLFLNDLMFGLIADGELYFKTDDENRPDYEAKNLGQFVYKSKNRVTKMSYFQPPSEALEDEDILCEWGRKAYEAAVRGRKKKR